MTAFSVEQAPRTKRNRAFLLAATFLLAALPGVGMAETNATATAQSAAVTSAEVLMYVLPDCGYCQRARNYFQQRGVAWREVNIASSSAAKAEFEARGGVGTPLIFVGQQRVAGFDQARLDQLLAKD